MPDSYRQIIDQTVIYLPTNADTLSDILSELRQEFVDVPPKLMWAKCDDDGHLVISVPVRRPLP